MELIANSLSEYELLHSVLQKRGYLTIERESGDVNLVDEAKVLVIQLNDHDGCDVIMDLRRLLSNLVLAGKFKMLGKEDKNFTAGDLSAVLKLDKSDFRYWSYNGLIVPSIRSWFGGHPLFSWADMLVAIIMGILRRNGVMPQSLEKLQVALISCIEEERSLGE